MYRFSSDTGEAILSDYEELRASVADDGVCAIKNIVREAADLIICLQSRFGDVVSKEAISRFQDKMSDDLEDMLGDEFNRLVLISGRDAKFPSLDMMKEKLEALRIPTNPQTYIDKKEVM